MSATPPSTPTVLPGAAQRYIGVLVAVGVLVLVWAAMATGDAFAELAEPSVIMLIVIGTASVAVPLRFHHDGEVQGFNVQAAVYLALTVLVADPLAVIAAGVMAAMGYGLATRSVTKTAFNTAQSIIWAGAATLSVHVSTGGLDVAGDVLVGNGLLTLAVAMSVVAMVNELLTAEVIHRHTGTSRRELLEDVIGPVTAISIAGNYVVAVLLIVLAERSPVAVILAVPLFAGLLLGYRGFAADRELARQAQMLHGTSRQLLDGALDDAALEDAVAGLRELFGADRSILAAGDADGPQWLTDLVTRVRETGVATATMTDTAAMAAPVELDGVVVGALAVQGRRGLTSWGPSDLALLSTVAGEIAATLRTRRLIGQVEQERARLAVETGKLTDVLASASDGIVVLDGDGRVEACNPAMAQILGMSLFDITDACWRHVLRLEDGEGNSILDVLEDPLVAALNGHGSIERSTAALRRPDGEVRWLRCSAAPIVGDGARTGTVLVAVDLTKEKEVEQLRSDFIATVSHELRTPLTPLSGFLGVLREHGGTLDDDRRTMMINAMEKQVGRLSDLIGDLLQVAEIERGLTHVHHEPVDIADVVTDLLDVEAAAPEARQRIDLDVAATHAMGDRAAIRRIIRALVSNGLKHTDGTIYIGCQERDGAVIVTVTDEGDGIAEWARDAIFEPFRRLGNHLHRTQGPGLGLAVARSLAESLDGSLGVTSASTGGARFVLHLPAAGYAEAPARTRRVRHGV